jgi:hypothetical protein
VLSREQESSETLTRASQDIINERDRLRSARASVTRQLGPLPASAGIAISLVGALARNAVSEAWLIVALSLLFVLVCVSIAYSLLPPYRKLRAKYEYELANEVKVGSAADTTRSGKSPKLGFDEGASVGDWLEHMIERQSPKPPGSLFNRQPSRWL